MTDDLRDKLHDLAADPPPPTGVPSEAVFARVRTIRRRRATGAAVLGTAAVAAIAVTAGNLTGVNSAPPVTKTPNQPQTIITGPPTTNPTTTVTATPKESIIASVTTLPPVEESSTQPPSDPPSDTPPPAAKPVKADVNLEAFVTGRKLTLRMTFSGTILVPRVAPDNEYIVADFIDNWLGDSYVYGDNSLGDGSDPGPVTCNGSTKRITGSYTRTLRDIHTYERPGTYRISYTTAYCGTDGAVSVIREALVTVK